MGIFFARRKEMSSPQTELLYVSGFKLTGKDHFALELTSGHFAHHWLVYRDPALLSGEPPAFADLCAAFRGARVAALADPVRAAVAAKLRLPPDYDWNANKDKAVFEGKLLRKHLIEEAESKRRDDPGHWAKLLLASVASTPPRRRQRLSLPSRGEVSGWQGATAHAALVQGGREDTI